MLRTYHFSFSRLTSFALSWPIKTLSTRIKIDSNALNPTTFVTDNGTLYREIDRIVHRYDSQNWTNVIHRRVMAIMKSQVEERIERKSTCKASRRAMMMIGKYRLSGQWKQTRSVNIVRRRRLYARWFPLSSAKSLGIIDLSWTSLNARFRISRFLLEIVRRRNTMHASI